MVQITLIQALLIATWVGLWRGTIFGYAMHIAARPLVTALAVGIILGRVPEAMVMGATLQLIYMGLIGPGGTFPADDCVATAVAVTVGLSTGISASQAVIIAVPVGIAGVYLQTIRQSLNSVFVHMADRSAEKGDTRGISRAAVLYPFVSGFLLYFIIIAIACYKGPTAIGALVSVTPVRVMHALTVVGGALPALGFAVIVFVIGKKSLLLYFVVAFFLAVSLKSLNINMIVYAIIGLTLAYLYVLFTGGLTTESGTRGGL
jgi:mannose/fructose/N-acetylgalactosamine-specific phosphotransferase system component IIC